MNSTKKLSNNVVVYALVVMGVMFTSATAVYTIETVTQYLASRAEMVSICATSSPNICSMYPDRFIGLLVLGVLVLLIDITILSKYFRQNKLIVGVFLAFAVVIHIVLPLYVLATHP